jgi:DNA-binding GntR family transcriptional regulator
MRFERRCMSDHIRAELAQRILDGRLKAGQRLVELEIAREFDTSQTPVREALRELETQRLVESEPYRGTRVRAISKQEMAEAYAVRGTLEQLAAELAAPRLQGNSQELGLILKELHHAARAGDSDAYAQQNYAFHRGIVEAAGNLVLLQTWDSLAFETRMRLSITRHRPNLTLHVGEHDAILQALQEGHGLKAGELLRKHAQAFMQFWEESEPAESAVNETQAPPKRAALAAVR